MDNSVALVVIFISLFWNVRGFFFDDSVCYQDIGCFTNRAPFDNTFGFLPEPTAEVEPRIFLHTRKHRLYGEEVRPLNDPHMKGLNFDQSRPTKFVIHGFMSSRNSPIGHNLTQAFLEVGDYNIFVVDWSSGSKKFYNQAAANTRTTGTVVSNFIKLLRDKFDLDLKKVHVLGHSLGAHIAGYIGSRTPGIGRITGLDPAGPLFENAAEAVRLDKSDAIFVDAIHTDAGPIYDAGFGTMVPMGDADFYPNGGGYQPGCPPPIRKTLEDIVTFHVSAGFATVSCSHDRAIWYFIESVLSNKCKFVAYPCTSIEDYNTSTCKTCGDRLCQEMGINAVNFNGTGTFYLTTNPAPLFCSNNQ
ncbi:hypothetical protein ACJMK2_041596 [Sinanodonta woodiana]|uniref:Lipase domain-containing protein n=1 Tax=Sinanodonta woodiana TaxID=1069815 RepID=A0ABD3W4P0_SINWO